MAVEMDQQQSIICDKGFACGTAPGGCGGGWSKRKRTRRVPSSEEEEEEEDMANCLVMLSTAARVDPPPPPALVDTDESSASTAKEAEEERRRSLTIGIDVDKAAKAAGAVRKGLFECKACNKVFNSHQALGGHRASHKKVKGCFASKPPDDRGGGDESRVEEDVITHEDFSIPSKINPHLPKLDYDVSISTTKISTAAAAATTKSKVHECSICHRIFASGQALGGHKRCHWVTSNSSDQQQLLQRPKLNKSESLDLNLPAPFDAHSGARQHDNFSSLNLQLPTAICIQQWIGMHSNAKNNDAHKKINGNIYSSGLHLDNEADCKVKVAKLSDLKDINFGSGGDSTPWLQVGIGSAAAKGTINNDP